ncbi:hypothetical protein ACJ41O_008612 [Fusarium nematophilum]
MSPCREDPIMRAAEAGKGAKKAVIHIYLATSDCSRRTVFNFTVEETLKLATLCAKLVRSLAKDDLSQQGTE